VLILFLIDAILGQVASHGITMLWNNYDWEQQVVSCLSFSVFENNLFFDSRTNIKSSSDS
jgi:hypothetical protein